MTVFLLFNVDVSMFVNGLAVPGMGYKPLARVLEKALVRYGTQLKYLTQVKYSYIGKLSQVLS